MTLHLPPFFLVWLKVPVNSVPSRRSCTRWSFWPAYCSLAAVDVPPFPSLLGMSVDHLARYVDRQLSSHWMRRGCRVEIFPGSCFSFFRTGCIQTFLVQIHSYVLILPRVLQQLTMGWIPGFNLPTPFHGDHTSFHAYYWEGSGVKCWGQNIRFSRAFRLLSGYSFICFFLATSLIGSLSDWVVWNFSCRYDPFR